MPFHPVFGPVVQLRAQGRFCSLGLESERIAREVDHVGPSVLGDMKITPSSGEGIGGIQLLCVGQLIRCKRLHGF